MPALATLGAAAALAAAAPLPALAAPNVATAPDLRADPVTAIQPPTVYASTEAGADRLLVRFTGSIANVGGGPLEIRGDPQVTDPNDPARVRQFAWAGGQGQGDLPQAAIGSPVVTFETAAGHDHFHLANALRYSLWNLSQTAEAAPAQKIGFCLEDLEKEPDPPAGLVPDLQVYSGQVTHFCEFNKSDSTTLRMGMSSGWRTSYDKGLAFQWVDVSSTSPGTYLLASQADPANTIWEGDGETNQRAVATDQVTVPGYVAKRLTVEQAGGPQVIPLSSAAFGTPGAVRYAVATPPAHGTLGPVTGAAVTYTPQPGYTGPDTFTYTARDNASGFPLAGSEPAAAVSINTATPALAISGAPATLIAGTGAQLSAVLSNAEGGVTWSTSAGTISASGLFTAPSSPPLDGLVTVRATSTAVPGLVAQVTIAISPAPVQTPAPLPPPATPTATTTVTKWLSRLTLARAGGRTLVATLTTGPRAGRVIVTMTSGTAVIGRCGARVTAHRTVSCRIIVRRGIALSSVRATATLAFGGRVAAVRRSGAAPAR
jgi:hypothetical protein